MAKAKRSGPSSFPDTRKRTLRSRAEEVEDRAWRVWFLQVAERREALADKEKKPFIRCTYEHDGGERTVARKQSDPVTLKSLVKETVKSYGLRLSDDLEVIRETWAQVVGKENAAETEIFSFKGGVLTIGVSSGTLLQELRQFRQDAILKDLRAIWKASTPLIQLKFRPGKR